MPVTLDGNAKRLVLDTGAGLSTLSDATVEQLGLPRQAIPLDRAEGVEGRPFQQATRVAALGFGATKRGAQDFLIEPLSHGQGDAAGAGLLGADILSAYDVDFDFPQARLSLYAPGGPDAGCVPNAVGAAGAVEAVDGRIGPGGQLEAAVTLDGKTLPALLDSGASTSVMTLDAFHIRFGLDAASAGVRRIGSVTTADGGLIAAYGYSFQRLALGPAAVPAPRIALIPDETRRLHRIGGKPGPGGLPELILGMSELKRMRVFAAYRAGKIYVAQGSE